MNHQFLAELRENINTAWILEEEPMRKHITFRVGGPADLLVTPDKEALPEVLKLCRKYEVPYYIIGNGSNLLVGDKGIRGLVIEMGERMGEITSEGCYVTAGSGALLSRIANYAAGLGLSGMEFAAGIPGSIGGAVVMNAGAYGGEMKDIISSVTVLDMTEMTEDGSLDCAIKTLKPEELDLSYRHSCIPENGYIVMEVTLKLAPDQEDAIRERMSELREKRVEKQPLEYPSAGSTFKRPEGYFAGKLIMDAGLRGYQVGGAQVSEKHCGFVVNKGDATAADILKLMQDVTEKVEEQFGVALEPEVKMLGEF